MKSDTITPTGKQIIDIINTYKNTKPPHTTTDKLPWKTKYPDWPVTFLIEDDKLLGYAVQKPDKKWLVISLTYGGIKNA